MEPFDLKNDYRTYLLAICKEKNALRGYRARLAQAAGCQPSYFSQVLKLRCHLTEDQLLGIAKFLHLSALETEFLILHLRLAKAATADLREYLSSAIQKVTLDQSDIKNRLKTDSTIHDSEVIVNYFASWVPAAIHLLTSSPKYRTPEKICQHLNLPMEQVLKTLKFLNEYGFVQLVAGEWQYNGGSIHIPKKSALQSIVQAGRKELAARSLAQGSEDSLHFSSMFTIEEKELTFLKEYFLRAIEKSHGIIQKSGTSQLACLCVDLFKIV